MRVSWAPLCPHTALATTSRRRWLACAQDQRVALAACSAQRGDGVAVSASRQLKRGVKGDTRPGHTDRMADRDGSAVAVDLLRVDAEFLRRSQCDRGECLVDLDDIKLVNRDAFAGNGF